MKKIVALLLAIGMMATFMGFASAGEENDKSCNSGCPNTNCDAGCTCSTDCKGDCCGATLPTESQYPDFIQAIIDFFKEYIIKAIEDLIAKITGSISGPSIG